MKKSNQIQQRTITGKVTDSFGEPLPNVTVRVKGTTRATSSAFDGIYRIEVASTESVLIFSYIGFESQEFVVGSQTTINVQLKESVGQLDEIVINAGYYNTTKREATGNISRVTAVEIENQPVVSPIEALQGRMAGVEIIPGGNQPGMASTIRIRGINSLREEGNFPLYIIDGVPVNSVPIETNSIIERIDPLNNLNISNIESIEVLKDADATAIYGSRGANGVVLITTKRGNKLGSGLEASFSIGAGTVPNRLNLLNTEQYLAIRRKAFENDGIVPNENNAYDLVLWDQERYTDWQDFAFGG
ncbi:MAG: TonB-dependent receptor plug domain-containing protein, partial [Flavobacteriales bacterium]